MSDTSNLIARFGMRGDVKKAESFVMSADCPVRAAPTTTDKSIALQSQW